MTRLGLLATTALAACLAAMLATAYQAPSPKDETLPRPAPRPATQDTAPTAQPGAQTQAPISQTQAQVQRILARPLFNPDRRPLATQAPGAAPATLPRLSAILVGSGGSTVIFAGTGGAKPVALAQGGRIGAYVVQQIAPGQVTLAGPSGTLVLHPAFDAASTTPPPALSVLDQLRLDQLRPSSNPLAPAPLTLAPR